MISQALQLPTYSLPFEAWLISEDGQPYAAFFRTEHIEKGLCDFDGDVKLFCDNEAMVFDGQRYEYGFKYNLRNHKVLVDYIQQNFMNGE